MAVAWMGAGFWGANALALAVTVVIAVVYLIGFAELCLFRRVTATLGRAFAALPAEPSASAARLDQWLLELHPSLRHALRRLEKGKEDCAGQEALQGPPKARHEAPDRA